MRPLLALTIVTFGACGGPSVSTPPRSTTPAVKAPTPWTPALCLRYRLPVDHIVYRLHERLASELEEQLGWGHSRSWARSVTHTAESVDVTFHKANEAAQVRALLRKPYFKGKLSIRAKGKDKLELAILPRYENNYLRRIAEGVIALLERRARAHGQQSRVARRGVELRVALRRAPANAAELAKLRAALAKPARLTLHVLESKPARASLGATPLGRVELTHDYIRRIALRRDGRTIAIAWDRKGAMIFADLTGRNVRKHLALALDRQVIAVAQVNARVDDGRWRFRLSTAGAARSLLALFRSTLALELRPLEPRGPAGCR